MWIHGSVLEGGDTWNVEIVDYTYGRVFFMRSWSYCNSPPTHWPGHYSTVGLYQRYINLNQSVQSEPAKRYSCCDA